MGDTVVKGIKDATIWLGEVTVLPSDKGGVLDRLKYGLYRATLKKWQMGLSHEEQPTTGDDKDEIDDEFKKFQELNPGMVKMYPEQSKKRGRHRKKRDVEAQNEMSGAFEQSEKQAEAEAKERGDWIAEDDHHYRHILISQIRKVWNDTNSSEDKQYTYAEWAYFLRLLGEDENDDRFHRRLPTKSALQDLHDRKKDDEKLDKAESRRAGQKNAVPGEGPAPETDPKVEPTREEKDQKITKWSWIGPRSPLM